MELEFYRNQNKGFSILTETCSNHSQIYRIRNNFLSPIFSLLVVVTQKDCMSCFIWVLRVSLRLTVIQKNRSFVFFKVTPYNVRVLCRELGNIWLGGFSLNGYKIIWKIKAREMKTKYYLETLIVLCIKWTEAWFQL